MIFLGRSKELGALRGALDGRRPSVVHVAGVRGGGKSTLVRRVVEDYPHVFHICPPLTEPAQRAALARRLGSARGRSEATGPGAASGDGATSGSGPALDGAPLPQDAGWAELFDAVVHRARHAERPFVLVLDDAHRLVEARARFVEPLLETLGRAREDETPLHVVMVGPTDLAADFQGGSAGDDDAPPITEIRVPPLSFRSAAARLPGRRPDDRLRAYGVFGGIPSVLQHLDTDVGVGTNVRRLLLSPEGPLADAGGLWLERDLQTPARYYSILATLAHGEADWGTVHEGVPDLTRSGQVAPYLNKLMELGLIEVRRSVDAAPGGRARRYAITDPFFAFWVRFILPLRVGAEGNPWSASGEGDDYAREIRPRLDSHLESILPMVCRQHMSRDAIETLGAVAREGGSLWGADYDLPVAGILTNGAAYFGACDWLPARPGIRPPLRRIEEGMRASRYGFGRQHRLRIVFTGRPPPVGLVREIARDPDARLIDAQALMG